MLILKKEPGGVFYAKDIPNTLDAMQDEIGGYIETVGYSRHCVLVCDEDGRLKDLPYNTTIAGTKYVGPVFFVGIQDDRYGETEFCDAPGFIQACLEGKEEL